MSCIMDKKKILEDKWPEANKKKKKAIILIIREASKAKIFEYNESDSISINR